MHDRYENPLITRYSSAEMSRNFSDDKKFKTWRALWIALAESEKELGLNITDEQIEELKAFKDNINYQVAKDREKEVRHDVMAHVYAYGQQCPTAKPIIHLGATSCFVGDNTDIIQMRDAIAIIKTKLINLMDLLSRFALEYKDMPTLGFTHFQPAQLTTVGKRAALWIQDILLDYEELIEVESAIKFRGVKGTTGTQASYLTLFDDDHEKVKQLEVKVADKMGFSECYGVTGQTYPRKLDSRILNLLSSIAQSAYKFSNDMRLLQNLKEMEEPFAKGQIGSSAMAYKRNPMRSERISALARFVLSLAINPAITASTQWFERTLDDSANKRLVIPQAFLAIDGILDIYINVADGLVVYPKVIMARIDSELPFMATEYILMEAVKAGGDRQELHEKIRVYSMEAGARVKVEGLNNDLIDRIKGDDAFKLDKEQLDDILNPSSFIGRSPLQVVEFIDDKIKSILDENSDSLGYKAELNV